MAGKKPLGQSVPPRRARCTATLQLLLLLLLLFVRAVVAVLVLGRWWRGEGPDRSGVVHWVPTPSLYGCRRPMGVAWRPRRGYVMPL